MEGCVMSNEQVRRNVGEIVRTAALERTKSGVAFILPWRMDANQDHLRMGLEECGCGFCPDDDQETT
jgi:hypothetical protein